MMRHIKAQEKTNKYRITVCSTTCMGSPQHMGTSTETGNQHGNNRVHYMTFINRQFFSNYELNAEYLLALENFHNTVKTRAI